MLKVTNYKRKPSEIYNNGVKMALVYENKTIHALVTCKDFISDIFWLEHQKLINPKNRSISIYDFRYSRKIKLLEQNTHELYLTNYPDDVGENLQNFLNEIEVMLNIPYSVVKPANNGYLIQFDKAWRLYPYMLSLFLLFVRIGGVYNNEALFDFIDSYIDKKVCINKSNCHDAYYLKSIRPLLVRMLINQEHFVDDWSTYYDVHSHHEQKRVVSFVKANEIKQ